MGDKKEIKKRVNKRISFVIGLLLSWFLLHCLYVMYDGFHSYTGNADIAIIPGNVVYADSSLSPWLKGRVEKAFELYSKGRVKKIFASGGKGEHHVKEGDAMRKFLLEKGVDIKDIIVDNNGQNTYLTAKDFITLDSSMHFSSAIVVSSFYHITRSKYIISKMGFKNIYGVSSEAYFIQDGFGLFREFFAFYKYVFFY